MIHSGITLGIGLLPYYMAFLKDGGDLGHGVEVGG